MEKITALEEAIKKNNLVGIYSVFYTIAHGDPNFSTNKFQEALQYVKSKNIEGFLDEFDGEEFEPEQNWDEDYWALVASSLMDNFCEERIGHLKEVGRKVYPMKSVKPSAPSARNKASGGRGRNGAQIIEFEEYLPEEQRKRVQISEEEKRRNTSAYEKQRRRMRKKGFLENFIDILLKD